jgi:hydrogenase maturation factor HypF (carbamoyltransferase family)
MNYEDYGKKVNSLELDACQARGHIIHRVAELEMLINFFLSQHFAKDNDTSNELLSFIFCTNRMTFEYKTQVFGLIIDKHYPDFQKIKPKFKKDLQNIAEIRNHFAHLYIDITDTGLDKKDTIPLVIWKGGKYGAKDYTKDEVNKIIDEIYDYSHEIGKLIE